MISLSTVRVMLLSIMVLAECSVVVRAQSGSLPAARISRGISIHEAMNWPLMDERAETGYVWPPFATERYALPEEVLAHLKQAGFDTIRLTVAPGIFLAAGKSRSQELDTILMGRVSRIIGAGFTAIVDFHPVQQDKRFAPLAFTRGPGAPLVEAFRTLLVRTAMNLSRLPKDRVVLEILNEPTTRDWSREEAALWQRTQKSYFDSVRAVAPELTLIVTGCCTCCGLETTMLDLSNYPGTNLYFTFHFYAPFAFTHQRVSVRDRPFIPTRFLTNVPFPLDPETLAQVERRGRFALDAVEIPDLKSRLWAHREMNNAIKRLRQFSTPADIEAVFDKLLAWAQSNGIRPQRIFLGEFGVTRTGADPRSRRIWLESVRRAAERRQMPWAFWSLGGDDYMGMALDRQRRTFDPLVLDALGLSHVQSP